MPPRLVDIAPVLAAMEQGGGQVCSKQLLKLLPVVDAVPVVRCKDCKRFVENKEALVTYCKRELKNLYVKPDDFCSYGERKGGEG